MVENTVVLNIREYNRLRDFYKNIEEGRVFITSTSYCEFTGQYSTEKYLTNEKVAIELTEKNEELINQTVDLRHTIANLKDRKGITINETTIDDVKEMSLWQFLKWRNK